MTVDDPTGPAYVALEFTENVVDVPGVDPVRAAGVAAERVLSEIRR